MCVKLKSERELLVNFVHRVWVWELGRKERVLRQQETLTSFKTGDERSVRHWSPDKRFPNERRQHRTSFPPLVRTIANGSNLGRVWRREAKLGIGYKARRRRGGEGSEKGWLSMSLPDTKVCLEVGVQISQRMCKMEQGLFVSVPKCCSRNIGLRLSGQPLYMVF